MKKILLRLFLVGLVFGAISCKKGSSDNSDNSDPTATSVFLQDYSRPSN